MITAGATTNAIGQIMAGGAGFGDVLCKTHHLHIATAPDTAKIFPDEEHVYVNAKLVSLRLGDLLSSIDQRVILLAQRIFDSGLPLRDFIQVMIATPPNERRSVELWTKGTRYKIHKGRVYGHRRM